MTRDNNSTINDQPPPHFLYRVAHLTWIRINESVYTKLYVITTFISTIICIVLESLIAEEHVQAASMVQGSDIAAGGSPDLNSAFGHSNSSTDPYIYILISLQRLKDENVFFILFHLFQVYLGIDALCRQSVIQLMAHTTNELFSIIFVLIQLTETLKWKSQVISVDGITHLVTNTDNFSVALRYEIGLTVSLFILTCIFTYLSNRLLRQFGWNTYKRLGADIQLQKRFRLVQLFLLNLKLDAFFQLVFSIFWFVVMTQEGYYQRSQAALVWYILHLILTLIQIPALFFARNAIRKEVPSWMIGFLVVHGLIIIDFIIVLQQSANSWVFWVLAVCLAILLSVTTMILGIIVTRNFGKGLQPHIQRLFDERYLENVKYNNNNVTKGDSWVIDDDPQQNENV